jgi:hypothetical protein
MYFTHIFPLMYSLTHLLTHFHSPTHSLICSQIQTYFHTHPILGSEFTPDATRGRFLVYIEYFWTIGSLFTTGIRLFQHKTCALHTNVDARCVYPLASLRLSYLTLSLISSCHLSHIHAIYRQEWPGPLSGRSVGACSPFSLQSLSVCQHTHHSNTC